MRPPRLTRRAINRLSPGARLVVLIVVVIAAAFGAWRQIDAPTRPVPSRAAPSGALTGIVSVIDGDTLDLHGQRIRLHGIDAPESRQTCQREGTNWRCGQASALALADHLGRQAVTCEQRDIDRYKRIVAICYIGTEDINAWLVRSGWAMAYRQYSKDYLALEMEARAAHAGIWAGDVQPPWEWRRKPKP